MTPTPEGKQLAADLANALALINAQVNWSGGQPWTVPVLETDARNGVAYAVAVKLFAEALADLREIDRIAVSGKWAMQNGERPFVATITAKWRVETDPLVEEAAQIVSRHEYTFDGLRNAVAEALKRGYEIGGKS